jgi:CHAT domain-containing protein/tetratricopeptide (TPR) repeat protein
VATSLNELGILYRAQGVYAKAELLHIRALDINEKALGPMHPVVAQSLNNLGRSYQEQSAYAKAEPLYLRAVDILEKVPGATHPAMAACLNNLATLYQEQGAYAKAEPLFIRALDIQKRALGTMHPQVANSLNNLAVIYQDQGTYAKAEPLFVQALYIREKVLGATHPEIATSLNNLASLYWAQGAYAKAEPLYIRALDIREKTLGPMHPLVALSLNNLATLYQEQGAYAKAEPLLVRALNIKEKVLGAIYPNNPNIAISLNNLAEIYRAQGAYTKAEPLLVRALDINEKSFGLMHPYVALFLNNLATLYSEQGAYAKAEPLLLRALDINEKELGPMHRDVALLLNNLAVSYLQRRAYTKAEPLFIRALEIREKVLGAMHPEVASSLNTLAAQYWAQHAYARAVPLEVRAAEIQEAQLRLELPYLSEPRKRALLSFQGAATDIAVSLHADTTPLSSQALELALTIVLRRKGRVLDSLTDNQLRLRAHLTPELRDKLDQLAAARAELSTRLRVPFDPRTAASHASVIATLRARVDELESALNVASSEFRMQSEPITAAKIRTALPRKAALIEFVRYNRFDPRYSLSSQEARYVAYVLPWWGPPQWVALGEAASIDAAVDDVLAAMHKGTSVDATKAALQHLDTIVFTPLRSRLTNVSHIILSPDGKLNLVPFEALVDSQGHYELEKRLVSYVTSGRDLLRLATRRAPRSSPMIVAAPDYGPPSSADLNGLGTFNPLEGTTAELAELPAYFTQVRTLTGDQATKAALAATVGPAVLHVATHGFYVRDAAPTPNSPNRATGTASADTTPTASFPPLDSQRGIYIDGNPFYPLPVPPAQDPTDALDRAGLAMAGANLGPDGIVSARELASYDWWGTQLVVLSACETGVGAVPSGEGVYGMRRALVLAGAESQVVSLWNVSDSSTRELMRAFYGELARGTGRAEALRRAKLRLLRQPKFAHPYYWAAFIPAGDWTPLEKNVFQPRQPHP